MQIQSPGMFPNSHNATLLKHSPLMLCKIKIVNFISETLLFLLLSILFCFLLLRIAWLENTSYHLKEFSKYRSSKRGSTIEVKLLFIGYNFLKDISYHIEGMFYYSKSTIWKIHDKLTNNNKSPEICWVEPRHHMKEF